MVFDGEELTGFEVNLTKKNLSAIGPACLPIVICFYRFPTNAVLGLQTSRTNNKDGPKKGKQ